jgi:antitoxin component HigA of HigAB toxin-antitoxin module
VQAALGVTVVSAVHLVAEQVPNAADALESQGRVPQGGDEGVGLFLVHESDYTPVADKRNSNIGHRSHFRLLHYTATLAIVPHMKALRTYMQRQKVNQTQLAALIGTDKYQVSRWLNGAEPSLRSLRAIAKALNIPAERLL